MDDKEQKQEITFTQEDLESINKDIADAQKTLKGDEPVKEETKEPVDTSSLREEIKAQIMAELKADADKKAAEAQKLTAEQEAVKQKQQLEQQLESLKSKIDEMSESKGVVKVKSPFTGDESSFEDLINDKEKVKAIDDASRAEFFKERG